MGLSFEEKMGCGGILGGILGGFAIWATVIAAWVTHIVVCIQNEQWILLIDGTLAFPIGVVHGIGQWFGIW